MRNSMHLQWTVPTNLLAVVAGFLATTALAGELQDNHLTVIPRTGAETTRIDKVIQPTDDFTVPEPHEQMSAGAATVRTRAERESFSQPSGNMSFERELEFRLGNAMFEKVWVSSPSSTKASDGLGPLYNARSCQRCHVRDGRGRPPTGPDDSSVSLFLRVSVPGGKNIAAIKDYIATSPDPIYGHQLQGLSLAGHAPEIRLQVDYEEIKVTLSDGDVAYLLAPSYTAADPGYGPLHPKTMISPRVAPQMIGLGLLEAIPAGDILAGSDEDDADGDGISGRANIVWSREFDRPMLGRFGLKAGTPTVMHQSAGAFANDIGISTPLFPDPWGECSATQESCRAAPHGDGDVRVYEVDEIAMDLVNLYSRNLAVPARRDIGNSQVLRGKQMFYETGCIACHTPKFVTQRLEDQPEQSFQLIWPYSDMLLHDMGDGLADNRPESRATGTEWRTPPLWGIGLTKDVSGHTRFLHDGRARNLLEAILWHGGEAEPMRDAVKSMAKEDREALIRFLESL